MIELRKLSLKFVDVVRDILCAALHVVIFVFDPFIYDQGYGR